MVAPAATTPLGGAALQSGDSPSSPLPTASSPLSPTPSLSHSVTPSLLTDLASPDLSFAAVAARHNLTVEELTLLVMEPDTRARIAATESAGCLRIRLVSTLNLNTVARTLLQVMEDFLTLSKSIESDPARLADIDYIRASDRARKAAWMLYRLARLTPVNVDALARARSLMLERTMSVSERTASSPPPASPSSASSASSAALRVESSSLSPASAEQAHATTPLSDLLTDSGTLDVCQPIQGHVAPAPGSDCVSSEPGLAAGASPTLAELTAQLEHLAQSLGIDTSDLDDPDHPPPLPPEFLAILPPALAAYLSEPIAPIPTTAEPPPALCGSSP